MIKQKLELFFQDLDYDGSAVSFIDNKKVKVFGVFPNERAIIFITSKKKNEYQGIPLEIVEPTPFRVKQSEDHYLSCSPWQVIQYDYQLELKKYILKKIFELDDIEIVRSPKIWGYRTKMEFSFFLDQNINLAFFKRGTYKAKYKLQNGCLLASKPMNDFAIKIVECLRNSLLPLQGDQKILKGIIVRESKTCNQIISSLFVKNNDFYIQPNLKSNEGFFIFYSNPLSPAFTFDQKIFSAGVESLTEKIDNLKISYGIRSFFQNNIDLFLEALNDIKRGIGEGGKVLELYCGVGTIGLFLSSISKQVVGVEINEEACDFAKMNAYQNGIRNFNVLNVGVEKMDENLFENVDVLVVDPPRSGLDQKIIKYVVKYLPKKIVYLSCNPLTQFRDFKDLSNFYRIEFFKFYDFYPQTPHIESLLILVKK